MKWHPDRVAESNVAGKKEEATARFQRVSEAYSVLRNQQKRAAYDASFRA